MKRAPVPRAEIMELPPYRGGDASVAGVEQVFKLSANEGALGASPAAIAAYRDMADAFAAYPDGDAAALRAKLAHLHGIKAEQIVCGNGSDEIFALLAQAYLTAGDEAIHTAHGFLIYKLVTRAYGGVPIDVAERDLCADIDAICAAVTERTRLVFLANPNNPTGTMLSPDAIARLHAALPPTVILVLDGAYAEFVPPEDYMAGFELVNESQNLVVTRSFSKAYGLAGLRVGWGYCPPAIAAVLNRLRAPFNINAAAMTAACAALDDQAHLQRVVAHTTKWRDIMHQQIAGLGFEVVPSVANFLLVRFQNNDAQNDAKRADEFCRKRGVILRAVSAYGLPDALRITIGTEAANRACLEALRDFAESRAGR